MYTITESNREVIVYAPAKINLHLEVGKRQPDGYHELTSLFQTVSLFDKITIRSAPHCLVCEINGCNSIPVHQNLMYQAVTKFRDRAGKSEGISISIEKKIPMKAGLGGGSSNAAAVLTACNSFWGTDYSRRDLSKIGEAIGSDVPFFCYGSPAAIVRGRGEKITCIRKPITMYGVIVLAPFEVETAKAYSMLDQNEQISVHHFSDKRIKDEYFKKSPEKWKFYNSFTKVISGQHPIVQGLISKLYTLDAVFASLTGSGSAVFGLFEDEGTAAEAAMKIRNSDIRCWKIKMLDRTPNTIVKYY